MCHEMKGLYFYLHLPLTLYIKWECSVANILKLMDFQWKMALRDYTLKM